MIKQGDLVEVWNGVEWVKDEAREIKYVGKIYAELQFITIDKEGDYQRWDIVRPLNTKKAELQAELKEIEEKAKSVREKIGEMD